MKVELSLKARNNLHAIHEYIAEDNRQAADRTVTRIIQSIYYLETFPELGRIWKGGPRRVLTITGLPYRAFYRVNGDVVEISTILHTSRREPK